jgi:hypothetical protein
LSFGDTGLNIQASNSILHAQPALKTKTLISNRDESHGSRGTTLISHTRRLRVAGHSLDDQHRPVPITWNNFGSLTSRDTGFSLQLRDDFPSASLVWLSPVVRDHFHTRWQSWQMYSFSSQPLVPWIMPQSNSSVNKTIGGRRSAWPRSFDARRCEILGWLANQSRTLELWRFFPGIGLRIMQGI